MGQSIVSYNPGLVAQRNLLLVSQRPLGREDHEALANASAVILPQACRRDLYCLVAGLGLPHFPRPALHLSLDGKLGNHLLFSHLGLPQPRTLAFADWREAAQAWREGALRRAGIRLPVVVKGAGGGEGRNVFLAESLRHFLRLGPQLETACPQGPPGLVLQELVASGGRDLRVVLAGSQALAYWRLGAAGEFRNNLSQGGRVERQLWPEDMARGLALARRLQQLAGIDLAGVDVLVPPGGAPLLLEINFYFGRQALGGLAPWRRMLLNAARDWLRGLGLDPKGIRAAR